MSQFIADFRKKNPQYNDMADDQLVSALHNKYYSDMDAEAFNQKIGYQSIAEEPIEQAQAAESQAEVIPQQEVIEPMQAVEPSMLDLVGSKLSELSADPVPNAFKGAIERAGDVGAGALTSINVAAKAGEEALGLGGLVWDGGVLPSYKGPEEYQAYLQQGGKDILAESEESAKGLEAGYVPTHTWEEVKREFSEGGALSGSAWGEVVGYVGEQGIKSVPDMAAALLNLPAYIIARSGEIGEKRAQNKGKEQTDLIDVVEAAPFAVGSALLERIGAKGITQAGAESFGKEALKKGFAEAAKRTAKAGGKAARKEAVTEAIQEGMIEYAGERLGTNAKMTLKESLDLAAAGAVAGGGMGGAAGTVSAGYKEATYNPEAELGKALGDFIDQSRFEVDQKAIAGQFDPANAQLEVRPEPQAIAEPKAQKPIEVIGEFEGVQPQGEFAPGMPESQPVIYDIPEERKAEPAAEATQKGKIKGLAVVEAPIDEVTLSSDVPQFKEGANASGVVEPLGGKFERTGVAPIQIWVREDGSKEVISGRHRLDLAKRSGETSIPAQYHYESEGFDVEQAASLDAILNIREGQGKVKDYVEFIQATKPTEAEAAAQGILARQTGKRAFTIADSGSDTLIASHRANQLSDEAATRIARAAPKNDALQSVGIKAIQDGKTIIMAENLVKAVGSMTTDKQQATDDLFGFDDSAMKEAVELAKKVSKKQAEIQRTLTAVTGAAKNPELARKEGVDVKDPEGIKKKINQLKTKKKAWDNWHTNPKLMEQLKGKKPTTSKKETVAGLPQVDADRLIADVKKGDLGVSRTNAIIKDIHDAVNGKQESVKRQLKNLAELDKEQGKQQTADEAEAIKAKKEESSKASKAATEKEQKRERIHAGNYEGLQPKYVTWLKSLTDAKRKELFAKGANPTIANSEFIAYKPAKEIKGDTRGKGVQYHGTSSPIHKLSNTFYSTLNYYGQGFYTTDATDIAEGYSKKGRGNKPTIYQVVKNKDLKIYDMEKPLTDKLKRMMKRTDGNFEYIFEGNPNISMREAYDELREYDEFQTADEVQETFDSIRYNLEKLGYDGIRHLGGLRTNKAAHNVEILFNPEDSITIKELGEDNFELGQQTEADIKAAEEKAAQAKAKEREAEQKAEADKQVGDFVLAGSDRVADQAEARGQGGLFDAPAAKEQTKPARATAQQIQKLTDIANDFNRGLDNVNKTVAKKAKNGDFVSHEEAQAAIKQHDDHQEAKAKEAAEADAKEQERANKLYGDRTQSELLQKLDELQGSNYAGGEITDGKRSTKKAVTNEAARSSAEEAMKLERFIKNKFGGLEANARIVKDSPIDDGILNSFKTSKQAAQWLSKNSKEPAFRTIASNIINSLPNDIGFELSPNPYEMASKRGGTVLGHYRFSERAGVININKVEIFPEGRTENTVLHELIHAATSHTIRNPETETQKQAITRIKTLMKVIKSRSWDTTSELTAEEKNALKSPLSSVDEFVTYSLTKPEFQSALKKIRPSAEAKSLFSYLSDAIKKLLGVTSSDGFFEQALDASSALIDSVPGRDKTKLTTYSKEDVAAANAAQAARDAKAQREADYSEPDFNEEKAQAFRARIIENSKSVGGTFGGKSLTPLIQDFVSAWLNKGSSLTAAEKKALLEKHNIDKPLLDEFESSNGVGSELLKTSEGRNYVAWWNSRKEKNKKPSSKKEPTTKDPIKLDYSNNAVIAFHKFRESTGKGTATKQDIQSSFDDLVESKEAVLAQLKKLTKAQLLKYVGRSDLKKPAMVEAAYKTMLSAHVFGDMVMTIFGGSKTYEEQIAEKVAAQTQEQIETDYERQREARAERDKRKESFVKSLTNPETLAEYKEFIRVQGKSKLSAEQLKTYDTLVADSMLEEDKAKPKTVQGEAEAVETTRAEVTHAKKGHQLYVVSLVNRVSKEQYKELNDKAKEFGGYYSAYNKAGAIPGFQFKTIEEADQFEQVLKGKDTDKSDFEEAKADVKNSKQADKLMEMADKLEAKGNESLGQDRQTNTGKRAAQAASASEKAYKQIATAQTVKQIATKMAAGEIVYLGKMTQITQLEELKSIQRKAVPSSMMHSEYDGYSISNSMKEGVTVEDYINNVRMPELFIDKERAKRFSDKLDGVKGFSRFAAELKKLPMAEGKVHLGRLTKDQVKKIHDAVKAGHLSSYELGFIPDREKTMNRLDKLGIKTDEQLRTAIRELDSLTVTEQKEDPIKKLERDLVGKKIDGYFPTPRELVEQMIDYAEIQPGHQVLEPSAGKGNIADIIKESEPNAEIDVIEINQGLRSMLEIKGYNVVSNDFTEYDGKQYDRIIMNPPFENFQDIDHVKHAYELLKPGGKLVAIMGAGVKNSRKKAVEFRQWIDESGSYIEDLPDGSFKSSERQTGVATVMVTIDKPDTNTLNRREDEQPAKLNSSQPSVVHAPGHNYVDLYRSTGIPSRKEVFTIEGRSIKMPAEPQRIEPIMRQLVKIMGRRIYNGKIKGKSVQGFYRSDVGELRTARKNDVEILAHEMAHYLDLYSNVSLPNFKRLYKQAAFKDEVAALSYTDDKKLELLEGFAEFVRLWLTNSNEAKLRAPGFYDAFVKELARDRKLLNPMRDMQEAMHKFYFQGPDKLGQALIGRDEGVYGKFMDWTYRRDSLIRQETIDKFHAAREVEKELTGKLSDPVQGSAWKQFRIANGGYEGIAEYIMNYGTLEFAENGDLVRSGKSLYEILKPVDELKGLIKADPKYKGQKPIDLLMRYFAGRRALELHRQGRENLIPKETAKEWAKMGRTFPMFGNIFIEYQEFNTRMMDMYQQAGLLTPEARQTMETVNKDYVPFNRLRDKLEEGKGGGGGFHRLKGGTANLEDILHNIQDGVTSNVKAALDAKAKQRLYQYIANHRDGAIWATKIAPDSKLVKTHLADMEKKIGEVLEASGVVIEGELDLSDPGLLNFWQHGVKPTLTESGNFVDTVLINGKPQYFEVQDPLLQEMLLTMNGESYSSLMNGMFAVKNFFTRSITLGVEFTGANLVRDTIGATFISKNQFRPFVDSFKGMYSYLTRDEHFQDFMRSGGGYSSRLHGSTKAGKARQRVQIKDVGVGNRAQRMLSAFDNLMSAFEYGTRIGEFRLAKKNGASDMDAAFAAREISTDFSVYGANHFLTGYIRTVPFLNAMIQSQDRVFREAFIKNKYGGNPTGLAMKAFLGLTVPTLLLWLINKDDEEYKEIPDHEKRTNWHVPLGNGRFMKVPRPYDVGFVYATMPELFFKYLEDENGKEYAEGMTWTLLQMYGIDGVPAAAQGWWDITRNKKWTGAPVVPKGLADVSASQQYNANTSETFIRLGQALNMSPIKAEHAFKAQTGYLGGYLLWGTEKLMWDEDKFGEMPDKDVSSNIFIKRFLTPETRPNNRSMEKFFDLKEESDRVTADFKAGIDIRRMIKGDKQTEFEKDDTFFGLSKGEKEVLFALNDSMNDLISIAYGKEGIKTQEHAIRYNPKLTGEQKRESLDKLWQQRNKMFTQYHTEATKALDKAKKVAKETGIEGSRNKLIKEGK